MKIKILTKRILGIFMIVLFTAVSSVYAADKPTIDKVVIKPSKNIKRGSQAEITISGTNLDQVNQGVVFRKHGAGKNADYFSAYLYQTPTTLTGTISTSGCADTGSYDLFLQTGSYPDYVDAAKKANVINLRKGSKEAEIISIKPNKLPKGVTKKVKVKGKNLKGSNIYFEIYKYVTKNGEHTSIGGVDAQVITQTISNNGFTALVTVLTDTVVGKRDVYIWIYGDNYEDSKCAKKKNGFGVIKK